jgi:hypothetical protein
MDASNLLFCRFADVQRIAPDDREWVFASSRATSWATGLPAETALLPVALSVHFTPAQTSWHPRSNRHRVVAAVAMASSAAYAATVLAIASFAVAWSARGEHLRLWVSPFQIEGSDVTNPGGWVSLPSDFRPEMTAAFVVALLAVVAGWSVVRLRRRTPAHSHSMRQGLLWGIPLVFIVGPAVLACVVWLTNSLAFG